MRMIVVGALGLLMWLVVQVMATGITAAGHGWYGPFFLSLPLLILYPLAFVRAFAERGSPKGDINLLIVGAALDLALVVDMVVERDILLRLWGLDWAWLALWLALWAGWQALGFTTLLRNPSP